MPRLWVTVRGAQARDGADGVAHEHRGLADHLADEVSDLVAPELSRVRHLKRGRGCSLRFEAWWKTTQGICTARHTSRSPRASPTSRSRGGTGRTRDASCSAPGTGNA